MPIRDASGEPIRCELVPVPPRTASSRQRKPAPPPLVLDIGINGAIRLTDPDTKALVASTWLAEVTTAPALYSYVDENNPSYTQPVLIVDIPDLQPLRIGARPMGSGFRGIPLFRYGWRGSVHTSDLILYSILTLVAWLRGRSTIRSAKEPAYVVTEAEWLTLVQKFGLGSRVVDEHASGEMEARERRNRFIHYVSWALILVAVGVALYMHFAR
jgi:hypothetical protein